MLEAPVLEPSAEIFSVCLPTFVRLGNSAQHEKSKSKHQDLENHTRIQQTIPYSKPELHSNPRAAAELPSEEFRREMDDTQIHQLLDESQNRAELVGSPNFQDLPPRG